MDQRFVSGGINGSIVGIINKLESVSYTSSLMLRRHTYLSDSGEQGSPILPSDVAQCKPQSQDKKVAYRASYLSAHQRARLTELKIHMA
jgi:hypothetical protein